MIRAELAARPDLKFPIQSHFGRLESQFLETIVGAAGKAALEPYNCDRVQVWHTKTAEPKLDREFTAKAQSALEQFPEMEV